jgi:hypothetical protein
VLHDVAILVSLIVFVKQGYSIGVVWIARDCRELVTKNRFYLNLRKTLFAYSNEFTDYQNAREENLHNVIFESDCLSLVFRLNSSMIDGSSVGIIVSGIKHLVKDFASVSFRHVKRRIT